MSAQEPPPYVFVGGEDTGTPIFVIDNVQSAIFTGMKPEPCPPGAFWTTAKMVAASTVVSSCVGEDMWQLFLPDSKVAAFLPTGALLAQKVPPIDGGGEGGDDPGPSGSQ